MRRVVLVGNRDTKRTLYFQKAAQRIGLPFMVLEWEQWRRQGFPDQAAELFIKADPPVWKSSCIGELNSLVKGYAADLAAMKQAEGVVFLNDPIEITALLDKRECKHRLFEAGVPVTEELDIPVKHVDDLLKHMRAWHMYQVFIKPIKGSGAAGVTAFRLNPKNGQMAAYSCARLEEAGGRQILMNTKRLFAFRDEKEIRSLVHCLLKQDCVVERWYGKDCFDGYSYDLRAVWQKDQLDFLLARLSKGPITNLHLNNHPLPAAQLGLSQAVVKEIERICCHAAGCYPGLFSIGIDILLEKGSQRPRIIEMNGQGDLLYQDIYEDNKIYGHQAAVMKEWLEQGDLR